ncbi:MAG: LruC domain-containing protein, partial [Prevotella sp.]|nr:LruC domain-containing protein [Prevotella sp.]
VQYSIIACGAYKELYILNINCGKITDNAEVHALFGTTPNHFVNTVATDEKVKNITVTKTVPETFSFKDPATQPCIYDKETGDTIRLATKGQNPHGIMIPNDFKYPLEKTCIKDAYKQFNDWGQHTITSSLWYTYPVDKNIYKK